VRWKRWQTTIGAFSAESLGLGGFTLDRHHVYDPIGRVLYRGDGSRVSARVAPTMLDMAATNTSTTVIGAPKSLAVLPDGAIAFLGDLCTIRKLDKDGQVTILAGQVNQCGFSGDGGPATQALVRPYRIATGPDGSLYLSESQNSRIRRIRPNGTIETVAGGGMSFLDDNADLPALNASLPFPGAIAVNKDGDIFVTSGLVIYRISPSGQLTRFAGGGGAGFPSGSNIVNDPKSIGFLPAPSALAAAPDGTLYIGHGDLSGHVYHVLADGRMLQIPTSIANPEALAVAADGTVYVTSITGMNRPQVKAIVGDSDVSTVAGADAPPSCAGLCGVGGPALAADLYGVFALAAAPDGAVWVADGSLGHLLRIRPSMPFVSAGFYEIMNDAGTEIYRFGSDGQHQWTKDARTGAVIESFEYDANRRLSKVTDRDGLETRFEHDPQTLIPTQIVGHFNHVTTLGTDNEGYLNAVTNPAGEQISMTYYSGTGLLQQWVDAKSQPTSFEYDFTTGRLTKDSNAANGFKTLLKTPIAGGYRVDLTTALSRKTSYDVQRSAGNANIRNVTAPSGLVTNAIETSSGERTLTFPDDSTMRMKPVGDPRFGLQSPIMAFEETKSGTRTRTIERTREVTMNPNTPTELVEQIDRVKINGLPFETTFTAALGLEDTKTPLNRHILRYVDATGRVIKEQIGSLEPMEYFYDGEGLLQQIKWGNRIWDLGYGTNGHISSIVNPLLEMTNLGTDAVGRLTSETNPLSHVTSVGYDDNGNASSVTPAGQPLHGMTYTPIDQLETYTAPTVNGQPSQTNWTYDFDGDLDKITLPDQSIVDHTRDNAGRPETIALPGSEGTITFRQRLLGISTAFTPITDAEIREALYPAGKNHDTMDQRLFHAMTLWTRYGSAKDPSNNEKLTEVNSIDTNRRVCMMCDDFIRTRSICTHIVRDHLYVLRETHRKKYDSNAQLRNISPRCGQLAASYVLRAAYHASPRHPWLLPAIADHIERQLTCHVAPSPTFRATLDKSNDSLRISNKILKNAPQQDTRPP
jgi:YD repeat-containing protein